MGCDIHFYVEKLVNGQWVAADKFQRGDAEDGTDDAKGYLHIVDHKEMYQGRNYDLFAILADVRNGSGFAGIKTGEGFVPISMPRGVPDDASPEYKEISDDMDCDGHSHSYFTLRELLDYDWTQTTGKQGWTAFESWLRWSGYSREQGEGPSEYSGGVSGPSIKHISADEMDALCEQARKLTGADRAAFTDLHASHYALAVWATPYYRAAGHFLSETIPRLLMLGGGASGIDSVRIVFFFDN